MCIYKKLKIIIHKFKSLGSGSFFLVMFMLTKAAFIKMYSKKRNIVNYCYNLK